MAGRFENSNKTSAFLKDFPLINIQSNYHLHKKVNILRSYWSKFLTLLTTLNLANDQLNAQIFNTFITILYMYMFRAISCSSSGGQMLLIQHLVSSLSVSDRPVHRLRENWLLHIQLKQR